jgi:hypothetical protein
MSIVNKLRIAGYGWLAVLVVLVWHLRPDEAEPTTPAPVERAAPDTWAEPRYELRGKANGYRVTAHAYQDAIRHLTVVVPAACARSPWKEMQVTWSEPKDRFLQRATARYGAQFTAVKTAALKPDRRGATPRLAVRAIGYYSEDGRRAHGTAVVRVKWVRNGAVVDSCESKPTRWSVKRL